MNDCIGCFKTVFNNNIFQSHHSQNIQLNIFIHQKSFLQFVLSFMHILLLNNVYHCLSRENHKLPRFDRSLYIQWSTVQDVGEHCIFSRMICIARYPSARKFKGMLSDENS